MTTEPPQGARHVDLGQPRFARWTDEEHAIALPARVLRALDRQIGPLEPAPPDVDPSTIEVPPSRLPEAAREALRAAVGSRALDETRESRLARSGGQAYADLIRRRTGIDVHVPDAVIRPADHAQVARTLEVCTEHRIAVVPYGGGTSVVAGVEPVAAGFAAVVTLDLVRLNRFIGLDVASRLATFQAGITGPEAERLLGQRGLTLGHLPQSFARASLGGYAATRSAGQASTGYGRFDDLVAELRMATPVGDLEVGTGTPNAAGPDLRALVLGSEGAFGVVTELTLRVRPTPQVRRYELWAFESFPAGCEVLRALVQAECAPDVVRLSDDAETETTRIAAGGAGRAASLLTRLRGLGAPVFCVLGWEGTAAETRRRYRESVRTIRMATRGHGRAVNLGRKGGEAWRRERFVGPVQRDALLDAGALVETLETAATWARLAELYQGVKAALSRTVEGSSIVMTHVSHVYPTGASLYFTVLARRPADPEAAIAQWARAKAAATDAIRAHGGTVSHHHGVGRTHAAALGAEIGPTGERMLWGVKNALDPAGILAPGVLLTPGPSPSPSPSPSHDGPSGASAVSPL